MRTVIVSISVLTMALAQSPSVLNLQGVWVVSAAKSRIGPVSVLQPVAIYLAINRSGVKLIQVAEAQGRRTVAVYDYIVEPGYVAGGDLVLEPSSAGQFLNTMNAFRARRRGDQQSEPDEQWCLSIDGLRLVIQRELVVSERMEKQILYFERSDNTARFAMPLSQ